MRFSIHHWALPYHWCYLRSPDELFGDLPKKLDVPQVADLLGMTKKGVYQWIHSGTIPAYKLGATWIILRDELRDAIASGSNLIRLSPPPQPTEESQEEDAD